LKLKKIEASLIKGLLRINWQAFGSSFFQFRFGTLSLFSLSLSLLDINSFLGAFQHWIKKGKEGKEEAEIKQGRT